MYHPPHCILSTPSVMKLAFTALLLATAALAIPAPAAGIHIPDPPNEDDAPKPANNPIIHTPTNCVLFGDECVLRPFGIETCESFCGEKGLTFGALLPCGGRLPGVGRVRCCCYAK